MFSCIAVSYCEQHLARRCSFVSGVSVYVYLYVSYSMCVCVCVCRLMLVTENNRFPLEFITTVRERTSTKKKKKRHFLQNNTREHMSCARTLTFSTASSSSQHGHHRQFRFACSGGNNRSTIRRTFSPEKRKNNIEKSGDDCNGVWTKMERRMLINGITGKMGLR